ncbi:MAG: hypothetical protein PHW79_06095 [Candidatus Marinimicrobia bacterium]|nr:hypothetical protein [Candidatus Neomarinimicrobiota bacterium]
MADAPKVPPLYFVDPRIDRERGLNCSNCACIFIKDIPGDTVRIFCMVVAGGSIDVTDYYLYGHMSVDCPAAHWKALHRALEARKG